MVVVILLGEGGRRLEEWEGILLKFENRCYETLFHPAHYCDARLAVQVNPGSKTPLIQPCIYTGFHHVMEVGQIFL